MHSLRLLFLVLSGVALLPIGNLLAQSSSPPATLSAEASVRAAFWNIRWFPGGRPNAYKGEQVRQIRSVHRDVKELNADVIGLEEVRDFQGASLAVEPLAGFKVDVCSNFPPREAQNEAQQVAIASRLQPMSAWAEEWKAGGAIVPPRGFAFAAYQVSPQQMLLVYALHLKSNRGELVENIAIREESVRQLLVHMKDMEAAYGKLGRITFLVGGDFNTAPDDPRFKEEKTVAHLQANGFKWTWQGMPLEQRVTLPPDVRFPAACFDHIFYKGATLRKAEVVPTSNDSSDHRAIRAEFDL